MSNTAENRCEITPTYRGALPLNRHHSPLLGTILSLLPLHSTAIQCQRCVLRGPFLASLAGLPSYPTVSHTFVMISVLSLTMVHSRAFEV